MRQRSFNANEIKKVKEAISQNIKSPSPMFDSFESKSGKPLFLMILIIGGEMKKLKKFASQKISSYC